jgi:hypothetical protein
MLKRTGMMRSTSKRSNLLFLILIASTSVAVLIYGTFTSSATGEDIPEQATAGAEGVESSSKITSASVGRGGASEENIPEQLMAGAQGTEYFKNITSASVGLGGVSVDVDIPAGALTHIIRGNELDIRAEKAKVITAWPLCNWKIRYSHRDLEGNEYRSFETKLQERCTVISWAPTKQWEGKAKPGTACAILKKSTAEGFVEVARQCHNVTKNDSWPVW